MSDFKGKMHQIQFQMGLRPRPRWGSLQRNPRPPIAGFKGLLLREGRRGLWIKGESGKKGEGKGVGLRKEKGRVLIERLNQNPEYATA